MIDFLKGIIPDELNEQLDTALKPHAEKVKIGNLAGGAYVGKDKHDQIVEQLKEAKATITQRDADLTALRALKPEELAAKITQLETQAAQQKAEADAKIAAMITDNAINAYASGYKFTSDLAREAFIGKIREAKLKVGEDGKLIGADDIAKGIKEKNPTAFEPEKKGAPGFGKPNGEPGPGMTDKREAIRSAMYGD